MARTVLMVVYTQPPFGSVKQVLNEEYTRCLKLTQLSAAFPKFSSSFCPRTMLAPKGLFYAQCLTRVYAG